MLHKDFVLGCFVAIVLSGTTFAAEPIKYVRFSKGDTVAYGILDGDNIQQIDGDLFGKWSKSQTTHKLSDVKLLPPTKPSQVLALAGNYRSHLGSGPLPRTARIPQPFFKSPSCLIGHDDSIVIPSDASRVDYEAELVIVIGKKCSKVPKEKAMDYVLGITAGNDVSERIWQNDEEGKDLQWWRAKGTDTFGPVGPCIASGLDYGNLKIELRHNGETKQSANTNEFIHDIPSVVSFISKYVTLHPGDLIFTGTSGETSAIKAGDVVEVEIEGVGVLRNTVAAEQ